MVQRTFTTRPELAGTYGVVASAHWLASAAGMAVLESGYLDRAVLQYINGKR